MKTLSAEFDRWVDAVLGERGTSICEIRFQSDELGSICRSLLEAGFIAKLVADQGDSESTNDAEVEIDRAIGQWQDLDDEARAAFAASKAILAEVLDTSATAIDLRKRFRGTRDNPIQQIQAALADSMERVPAPLRHTGSPMLLVRRYLYSRFRRDCPRSTEDDAAETQAMADGAMVLNNGQLTSATRAGVRVVRESCEWGGETIQMLFVEIPVEGLDQQLFDEWKDAAEGEPSFTDDGYVRLRLYTHQIYIFHPDVGPVDIGMDASDPLQSGTEPNRVWVVDTGWNDPQFQAADPANSDPFAVFPGDRARGHGPAIVDLIDDLLGPQTPNHDPQVHLHAVRYGSFPVVLPAPDGSLVRAFDEFALWNTLRALEDNLQPGDVVNLSLGAVACPKSMVGDRVGAWIASHPDQTFVVAAGNHSTSAPSFPAAYGQVSPATSRPPELEPTETLENVISVGSAVIADLGKIHADNRGSGYTPHDFSAQRANWIMYWANGENVPVDHYDFAAKAGKKSATWTGTSFAAPKIAAQVAAGLL